MKSILLFFLLLISACSEKKSGVTVAVASNFEPTLKRIIKRYNRLNPEAEITVISASSGILTNQVLNNAPFDLFLSADSLKPQLIHQKLTQSSKPTVYATGKLALWIPKSAGNSCLSQLPNLNTLAIANPKTAPYGKVAQDILTTNKLSVHKTIQTANAAQAYSYTKDGLTQAGFVPYSLLINDKTGCQQLFDNKQLSQSMILLNKNALGFYDYLQSAEIKKMIKNSGYR